MKPVTELPGLALLGSWFRNWNLPLTFCLAGAAKEHDGGTFYYCDSNVDASVLRVLCNARRARFLLLFTTHEMTR